MRRELRDLIALMEKEGFLVVGVDISRHYKLRLSKEQVQFMVSCSISPSDSKRWLENVRSDIRRAYKQAKEREHG